MDRERVKSETIEVLCHKLHALGDVNNPVDDIESKVLFPDVTEDELDVAEVTMDLEDAFGTHFTDGVPGDPGLETVGEIIDFLYERVNA